LAAALEEAPGYSKARLAHELRELVAELFRVESERRREEEAVRRVASRSAEQAAGVRRQKAFLASIGVADVSPDDLATRPAS
jgi:hypothetical protein